MPSVAVNGTKAHYREWGNGSRTILMLHGWPADSSHYTELGPALAKHGYTVIVPDFPGFGQTPPPPQAWKVSDYRDWVHAFLEAKNIKSMILFGHSFGGRVSIKYAINHAYQIEKLILCASAGIKTNDRTPKRKALSIAARAGKKLFRLPGVRMAETAAKKLLYRLAGSKDYFNATGVMKQTIVKVLEEDLSPFLPQITIETLLLWGTEDGATPLSDAKKMHALIPNSTLTTFQGQKHNLVRLIPQELAKEIDAFVRRQSTT